MRDLLSWVSFINVTESLPAESALIHGAFLVLLDGLSLGISTCLQLVSFVSEVMLWKVLLFVVISVALKRALFALMHHLYVYNPIDHTYDILCFLRIRVWKNSSCSARVMSNGSMVKGKEGYNVLYVFLFLRYLVWSVKITLLVGSSYRVFCVVKFSGYL